MRKNTVLLILIFLGFNAAAFGADSKLRLSSPAFSEKSGISAAYTCKGKNASPPLIWTGIPDKTQSFAILLEDLDAKKGVFTHWILYDLPPTISNLPEGLPDWKVLINGEKSGLNDFEEFGYGGPCPPKKKHRYVYTLYALDVMPNLDAGVHKAKFLEVIQGHILATAKLEVRYKP